MKIIAALTVAILSIGLAGAASAAPATAGLAGAIPSAEQQGEVSLAQYRRCYYDYYKLQNGPGYITRYVCI